MTNELITMDDLAKLLILFGLGIAAMGGILWLVSRLPGVGRLPGDFVFTTGNVTCMIPLATSILLSIILTVLLNLIFRFWK